MAKLKFPTLIFVRKDKDGDVEYLLAFEEQAEAIDEDGPTAVATYKLVEENKLEKVAQVCS